jgi:hypothetical protein
MNAPGRVVVWVCAAVVALPLSPCAFFSTAACRGKQAATEQVARTSERPCCAQHTRPLDQPTEPKREKPCRGECCLLSPFAQTGDKLVLESPALTVLSVLPHFDGTPSAEATFLTSAAAQPLSLHILHCQWRC